MEELEQELKCEDRVNSLNSVPTKFYQAYKLVFTKYMQLINSPQVCRLLEILNSDSCKTYEKPIDFTKLFTECYENSQKICITSKLSDMLCYHTMVV